MYLYEIKNISKAYCSKVSNTTVGPQLECRSVSTIKPFILIRTDFFARLSKSLGMFLSLAGSRSQKEQLPKETK